MRIIIYTFPATGRTDKIELRPGSWDTGATHQTACGVMRLRFVGPDDVH
jgi:hypothetical protein